ncbi:BTAD domain-containing putative transcriptional regulator [Nocardioides cremeus]|jgi:DNA-binding SARP family transcriptional activator|uniref:BTAD domain-containing putative transcriptional regulator n=1 Tax=Nocardioides cremeus TaxID=3058044 RepID=A0ABT8TPJ2_9ACTN|nr:BTAD domain-containing putative transcriptional regulator [Nocardioides cremeus]MDO3395771.1 BTAD domain-containing putative transcriptional regulator [Nocardioides cremeus]
MRSTPPVGITRIRLLDDLFVVRADGTPVHPADWRTGKTMDLLRMLALHVERPVRVESIIERLWPDASRERGRGSLRTAVSEVRRQLGDKESVVRIHDSLVLTGVWVDVAAFEQVAGRVRAMREQARPSEGAMAAMDARDLYRDDLRAYDDDADWVRAERERLRLLRQDLLTDAAECAVAIGCHREAATLAKSALHFEPTSEIAVRTLMTALSELGDVARALRVYADFRACLVDDLGVEPSHQTRGLHLRLLRGESPAQVGLQQA